MKIRCFYRHGKNNFGDMLTPLIIEYLTNKKTILTKREDTNKILACGSILTNSLKQNDYVWGTGAMREEKILLPKGAKIYALRGPLTRKLIQSDNIPEIYGDPAILLSKIFNNLNIQKKYKIGLLPHFSDYKKIKKQYSNYFIINITASIKQIIDQINACEIIITSSLHGMIVSEIFKIPVVWTRIINNSHYKTKTGNGFKFNDYLASTNRDSMEPIDWKIGIKKIDKYTISFGDEIDLIPLELAWEKLILDYTKEQKEG